MDATIVTVGVAISLVMFPVGFLMGRSLRKWARKVRRRKGGVYVVRVDHHLFRARRVWGYVGETVNFHLRQRQHLGYTRYDPNTGEASPTPKHRTAGAPWSDLNPVWIEIHFPWWLCFKPILRSAETVVMLLTWPVYNDAKNRWNPRRIDKGQAKLDRARRDAGIGVRMVWVAHAGRRIVQVVAVALILTGFVGWAVTR